MDTSLSNCIEVEQNFVDNYGIDNTTVNLTKINIAILQDTWDKKICFMESEMIKILMSKIHGKSNVTVRAITFDKPNSIFSKQPEIDMFLQYYTIEAWLLSFSKSTWIYDDHNLVILSAIYPQPRSLIKLLNIFSLITWILILEFVILIAFLIYMNDLIKGKSGDFAKAFSLVLRILVNQGFPNRSSLSNLLTINVWSLISIVLVSSFSGQILSSILFQPMKTIENFDELIKSNLTIITGRYSFLDSVVPNYEGLDYKMNFLKTRLTSISDTQDENQDEIVRLIIDRKAAYIREGVPTERLFNKNIHISSLMYIAQERYFSNLVGYPINNVSSSARTKIFRKIKHSVEAGINRKWLERMLLVERIEGLRKIRIKHLAFDDANNLSQITLEILKDLFFALLFGSAISSLVIIAEILAYTITRTNPNRINTPTSELLS